MSRQPKPKPAAAAAPASQTAAPEPAAAAPVDPIPVNTPQVAPDPTGAVSAPASAAAEAAAAPVDPKDDDHADQRGPEGYVVAVTGPAKGRWRIGRKFGPETVEIPAPELTESQLRALLEDPELTVKAGHLVGVKT